MVDHQASYSGAFAAERAPHLARDQLVGLIAGVERPAEVTGVVDHPDLELGAQFADLAGQRGGVARGPEQSDARRGQNQEVWKIEFHAGECARQFAQRHKGAPRLGPPGRTPDGHRSHRVGNLSVQHPGCQRE